MTWQRAHLWCDDRTDLGERTRRCQRCGCCSHWPLAQMSCSGAAVDEDDVTRATRKSGRKPSTIRQQVEAHGVAWDTYKKRRRRGWSHQQAIDGAGPAPVQREPGLRDPQGRVSGAFSTREAPRGVRRKQASEAGVDWDVYRDRRRRGWTHEEALAGERARRAEA